MSWLDKLGLGSRRKRELTTQRAAFASFAPYRIATRLEGLTAASRPEVEGPLFTQWRRELPERLGADGRSTHELALAAVALSRSLLVTQRQIDLDVRDSFEDGMLEESMTILTSGLCNCEMANYIVWLALADAGHDVHPFETGATAEVSGNHLLLYLVDDSGCAFVDAWSDIPLLHVEDFVPPLDYVEDRRQRARIEALAKRRPPDVPTHTQLGPAYTRASHGLYPEKTFTRGQLRSSFDNIDRSWSLATNDPEPSDPSTAPEVWRDYVELRTSHVLGELAEPVTGYDAFALRDDLPPRLREVVEALAARQKSPS